MRQLGPYLISGELGRGAMSVVYRARRMDSGPDVALKVLEGNDPARSLQFRREAAALARLRHPALIDVFELGEASGRQYLAMELVEGQTLARQPTLQDEDVHQIGLDLASALCEVHRHGLLHRDIKPSNVLLAGQQAKLIDFGLVGDGTQEEAVGTLHYAAPEQLGVIQRAAGPPADLYALGATLFYCLVGEPPISGDASGDYLYRLATTPAPSVAMLRPGTDPALAAVIDRLLQKDPDDRYPDAWTLLRALQGLDGDEAAQRPPAVSSAFVGREEEMARLQAAWADAGSTLRFVRLLGEGGSGKSRLAAELARQVDARVIRSKCQALDRSPFGPLREALDGLVAELSRLPEHARRAAVAALGDYSPLVGRLSPGLAQIRGPARMTLEPGAEQQRFFHALADFIAQLGSRERPLLWLLDDVQWLDAGSQEVLSMLAQREGCGLILMTARPTPAVALPASVETLPLPALSRDALGALATASLGGRPLATPLLDRLLVLTRGNPFALKEYLRALLDSGALRPGERWDADPAALASIGLPDDVLALLVRRLAGMEAGSLRLLRCAAVLGGRFELTLLEQLSGVADVSQRASRLIEQGLLARRPDDTLSFPHDRVREAVMAGLVSEERRDIHQAVAELLVQRTAPASSRERYALARHLSEGHPERDPARAAAANLRGGLTALEEHAYEAAFEMLERARELYARSPDAEETGALCAALGRACAMTGRLEEAFAHLEAARAFVADPWSRFELQYLITLTYASQGQNDRGLAALYETFELLGSPYPRSRLRQGLSLVWLWASALLLSLTGWRAGSAAGEAAQRRQAISRLHYLGSMLALFDGDTFLTLQFIVRDFHNVHFLPPSGEKAIGRTNYGALMGTLALKGAMKRHTSAGVAIAEQADDRAATAVCRAYAACGHKWAGDLDEGTRQMQAALPLLARDVPGSWYSSIMITEQAYSFMHCGQAREALAHIQRYMPMQARTGNQLFGYNTRAAAHSAHLILGDDPSAAEVWAELEPHYARYGGELRLTRGQTRFERMIDRLDFTDFDEALPELEAQLGEDYYSLYAWELYGYARMLLLEAAEAEAAADTARARRALKAVISSTFPRFIAPVFRCHRHIWQAALDRSAGRPARAARALARAERLLEQITSPRAAFRVAEQRALLAEARGAKSARLHARQAQDIALEAGWLNKAAHIRQRFGLSQRQPAAGPPTVSHTFTKTSSLPHLHRTARYADAMLEVSLASAETRDLTALTTRALSAIARVLGAERALFFLLEGEQLSLVAAAGQDVASISRTVVEQALARRTPVVIAGDARGEELESESILAHGLRSVMAAPLLYQERVLGVVYVDNRLARGLFSADDVQLMLGMSNHIAIAVETARAAQLEVSQAAMARDFELVGAVQSMLLPARADFTASSIRGFGLYRPAARCGGDWWWQETLPDGSVVIWMGDVNGHGAGPAMITAAVSGAFRTLRALQPDAPPPALLDRLHQQVQALGGRFLMTMSAVQLRPAAGGHALQLWSAGAPPLFLRRASGAVELLVVPGRLLGEPGAHSAPGYAEAHLARGDQLLICTDGLIELDSPRSERPLGARGLARFLGRQPTPDAAREALVTLIEQRLGDREQPDDITAVLLQDGG